MSVPLVADTGVIVESLIQEESRSHPSADRVRSLVRFTTLLGLAIGVVAPFVTIAITLLIAYGCARLDVGMPTRKQLFVLLDILWGLTVLLMALSAPNVLRGSIFKCFNINGASQALLELVELRMALGTLVGVLASGIAMCFFLDCGFWEYSGLVFGGIVVLSYCGSRSIRLNVNDCKELELETNDTAAFGIVVV